LQLLADVAKAHAVYICMPFLDLCALATAWMLVLISGVVGLLVAGTMTEVQGGKRYVTSVLLAADGTMAGLYRKRKPTIEGAVRAWPHWCSAARGTSPLCG
jgi:predicted amidohydrolase